MSISISIGNVSYLGKHIFEWIPKKLFSWLSSNQLLIFASKTTFSVKRIFQSISTHNTYIYTYICMYLCTSTKFHRSLFIVATIKINVNSNEEKWNLINLLEIENCTYAHNRLLSLLPPNSMTLTIPFKVLSKCISLKLFYY